VANQTSATFLRVVGSELIQKYLGDGPKLVRELFRVADDLSPSIVFIDEIDAVGSKRYDSNSGGTREIQRTMLELLNQLDGFDERGDVKVRAWPGLASPRWGGVWLAGCLGVQSGCGWVGGWVDGCVDAGGEWRGGAGRADARAPLPCPRPRPPPPTPQSNQPVNHSSSPLCCCR
jgi:hypothetical protein